MVGITDKWSKEKENKKKRKKEKEKSDGPWVPTGIHHTACKMLV